MYNFNEVNRVAALGMSDIEKWLKTLPETVAVENVEDDAKYREADIDLIWKTKKKPDGHKVELKVDRYHKTGNFFFETHSNVERNTPGCFMYTEADLLFYYFIEVRQLYILPMLLTREWFEKNINQFRVRDTHTPVGQGFYTTRGRLVKRELVMKSISNARLFNLPL